MLEGKVKMSARPQLSLCIPICSDQELLREFDQNVTAFFQKFPLVYEILFAVAPKQDQSLSLLKELALKNPRYKISELTDSLSRAQRLENLFKSAQGDILMAASLDLTIPLSECFKILEVFYSDRNVEAVFGDRSKSKKNLENHPQLVDNKIEIFFSGVIHEKAKWPFHDLFCPVFGIRKSAFEKIQGDLHSRGWHWTHEIQRLALKFSVQSQEIPIYSGSRPGVKPPFWQETLALLNFVLFRI